MAGAGCQGDSRTNRPLDTFPTRADGLWMSHFRPVRRFHLLSTSGNILLVVLPSPSNISDVHSHLELPLQLISFWR